MSNEETNTTPPATAPTPEITADEMKMPEQTFGTAPVEEKSSVVGAILVALIVVLVLILGGLYLWGTTLQNMPAPTPAIERPTAAENNEPESTNAEADVETATAVSTSDEIDAIEADLESTNMETLDAELEAIDAELEAALEAEF